MKTVFQRTIFVLVIIAGSLYVGFLFRIISKDPIQNTQQGLLTENVSTPTPAPEDQKISGVPIKLTIPALHISADIESVGLTADGAMDVPQSPFNVAWFNLGPRPGEKGTAVIDGHYGRKNGRGASFDELYKLRKGDKIFIEDKTGTIISFVVRENRRYDPKADATSVFGTNQGPSHLNLITCEGEWNKVSGGYPQRLVIFTDKE